MWRHQIWPPKCSLAQDCTLLERLSRKERSNFCRESTTSKPMGQYSPFTSATTDKPETHAWGSSPQSLTHPLNWPKLQFSLNPPNLTTDLEFQKAKSSLSPFNKKLPWKLTGSLSLMTVSPAVISMGQLCFSHTWDKYPLVPHSCFTPCSSWPLSSTFFQIMSHHPAPCCGCLLFSWSLPLTTEGSTPGPLSFSPHDSYPDAWRLQTLAQSMQHLDALPSHYQGLCLLPHISHSLISNDSQARGTVYQEVMTSIPKLHKIE